MSRALRHGWIVGIVSLAAGCADGPGHGFATLERVELQLGLRVEPARTLGERSLLTDQYYELRLDRAELRLSAVSLVARSGPGAAAGPAQFDPANPPPGYTLCHNGHCHHQDGRLVSYEAIEAELAGGGAATTFDIAQLPVDDTIDLWAAPGPLVLSEVTPSRELPMAELSTLRVGVEEVTFSGTIGAGPVGNPLAGRQVPLRIVLPRPGALQAPLNISIDAEGPGAFRLEVEATVGARMFDGVPFVDYLSPEGVVLESGEEEGTASLAAALLALELQTRVVR